MTNGIAGATERPVREAVRPEVAAMTDAFVISGVRVTYDCAAVADLETASFGDWRDRIDDLLASEGVTEAAVLQTCNRVEEYVVTESEAVGRAALSEFPDVDAGAVVEMDQGGSLRHLLRVAAGLESQVLGEDQILGQVREAYAEAADRGALGDVLEPALLKAIHVGERARTETAINEGTVSLGSAAIDLAEEEYGLAGRTVAVVGAGEMAGSVATSLPGDVAEVRVLNRSPERAEELGRDIALPVTADDLSSVPAHLPDADVVFSATGSRRPVIDAEVARAAGETLLLDLGQPRDVASGASEIPGVTVRDLDGLRTVTETTHEERAAAAREVEAIVDEELDLLFEQYKRARADAVISGMYRGAEHIKEAELRRALEQLDDLDAEDREVVESLADALVSQILAVPTRSLRDAAAEDDWETITTAIDLFDPTGGANTEALFQTGSDEGVTEETPADGSRD
ncbi:MAG: glutamyl-tRNA reductase [Haloarculaceae archaeon]